MNLESAEDIKAFLDSYKNLKQARISDLLILGLLSYQNLSGYDIYKFIEQKADFSSSFLKLQKATVYNTLSRMVKDGYVSIAEKRQDKNRPRKSIYTLTEKGKTHLKDLLISNMSAPPMFYINYYLDIILYHVFPKEDIKRALQQKIDHTETFINLAQLYAYSLEDTVLGILLKSEIKMLTLLKETMEHIKIVVESNQVEDVFQVGDIRLSRIVENMESEITTRRNNHD